MGDTLRAEARSLQVLQVSRLNVNSSESCHRHGFEMSHAPGSGTATLLLRVKWDVLGHVIQLRGHDEVVLVQAFDLLGLEGHRRVAPAEADIRVMPLGFCEFSNFVHEREGLCEVLERIGPLDSASLILD